MNKIYFKTIHNLISKGHWITHRIGQVLKADGISEPQYNVLRLLLSANGKPMNVQAVQKGMVQQGSNVTRIVDKLLAKNLVERKENPTNRRKMDLTITTLGKKLLKKLDKKVRAFHEPLMNEFNDRELKTLENLLNKLDS